MTTDNQRKPPGGPPRPPGRAGSTALYAFAREEERLADAQLADLQAVDAAQGGGIEWYCDWAGRQDVGRPAYATLLEDLAAGRITWLVVWSLHKLGLASFGLQALLAELARVGCGLTSLQDGLCLEPEVLGELPAVLLAVGLCQAQQQGDRIALGCAAAKKAGVRWGGSRAGRSQGVSAEQRAQVAALAAEGRPKAYIARLVGLSRDTVYRLLGRPQRRRRQGAVYE